MRFTIKINDVKAGDVLPPEFNFTQDPLLLARLASQVAQAVADDLAESVPDVTREDVFMIDVNLEVAVRVKIDPQEKNG